MQNNIEWDTQYMLSPFKQVIGIRELEVGAQYGNLYDSFFLAALTEFAFFSPVVRRWASNFAFELHGQKWIKIAGRRAFPGDNRLPSGGLEITRRANVLLGFEKGKFSGILKNRYPVRLDISDLYEGDESVKIALRKRTNCNMGPQPDDVPIGMISTHPTLYLKPQINPFSDTEKNRHYFDVEFPNGRFLAVDDNFLSTHEYTRLTQDSE